MMIIIHDDHCKDDQRTTFLSRLECELASRRRRSELTRGRGLGFGLGRPHPGGDDHDDGDDDDVDDDNDHDYGDDVVDVDYVGIVPGLEWSSCGEVSLVPNSSLSPQSWLACRWRTFRNLDTIFIMVVTLLLSWVSSYHYC